MELLFSLHILTFITALTSIVLAVFNFNKLPLSLKVLSAFTIYTFINELLLHYTSNHGIRNVWLANLFTIVEYISFSTIYYIILKKFKYTQAIFTTAIIGFITMTALIFYNSFTTIVSDMSLAIESIVLICISVIYFYQMLDKIEYDSPFQNPLFWFSSAVLIYFSGAFFFFIFIESEAAIYIWYIHNFIRLIYSILILITFWKARKVQISY